MVILCLSQISMVLGKLASSSSSHTVPKSDTYGIREPVILCLRQICMVLGNLASNSSDHIVPKTDMYEI